MKAEDEPILEAKPHKNSALLSLTIPPQADALGVEAPSVLHLIHKGGGGFQMTSLRKEGLGG
jgi:hypothetical protein